MEKKKSISNNLLPSSASSQLFYNSHGSPYLENTLEEKNENEVEYLYNVDTFSKKKLSGSSIFFFDKKQEYIYKNIFEHNVREICFYEILDLSFHFSSMYSNDIKSSYDNSFYSPIRHNKNLCVLFDKTEKMKCLHNYFFPSSQNKFDCLKEGSLKANNEQEEDKEKKTKRIKEESCEHEGKEEDMDCAIDVKNNVELNNENSSNDVSFHSGDINVSSNSISSSIIQEKKAFLIEFLKCMFFLYENQLVPNYHGLHYVKPIFTSVLKLQKTVESEVTENIPRECDFSLSSLALQRISKCFLIDRTFMNNFGEDEILSVIKMKNITSGYKSISMLDIKLGDSFAGFNPNDSISKLRNKFEKFNLTKNEIYDIVEKWRAKKKYFREKYDEIQANNFIQNITPSDFGLDLSKINESISSLEFHLILKSFRQQQMSELTTQKSLGLRVSGTKFCEMNSLNVSLSRYDCATLNENEAMELIHRFFRGKKWVVKKVINKIVFLIEWMEKQNYFSFYSTSVVFFYDEEHSLADVRWIDFSHTIPTHKFVPDIMSSLCSQFDNEKKLFFEIFEDENVENNSSIPIVKTKAGIIKGLNNILFVLRKEILKNKKGKKKKKIIAGERN